MIPHIMYFRLQAFRQFWHEQLQLHPRDRFTPIKYHRDPFELHSRNMKRIGDYVMAKKKAKAKQFEFKGYVNIDIPEKEVSALEIFAADDKQVFFEYNAILTTNYTVKQYYDDYSEAIKTVATCFDEDNANFGYSLSAYADDWYTSLAVLLYKHLVLADRDWDSAKSNKIKKFG